LIASDEADAYLRVRARSLLASLVGILVYGITHDIDTMKIFWVIVALSFTVASVQRRIDNRDQDPSIVRESQVELT
jgi:hypothetical protein